MRNAMRDAAVDAVSATLVRDLIAPAQYDMFMAAWKAAIS
jgi:hypothetical protein